MTPRPLALALACAALALTAAPARAIEPDRLDDPSAALNDEPEDYDVGNGGWNGLSTFYQLAAGDGFEVTAVTGLDWDELGPGDVLVILYPTNELDAGHVNTFVRNGGRLVLADDFGHARKTFWRLGIARDEGAGASASRYYDDLPFAPIATPRDPTHPLARGVTELVTNHPAIIDDTGIGREIFGFGAGESVVVAGELGAGSVVVLSDPSILINSMLHHPGNFQFALNLLRYFAGDGPRGRVFLLAGEFSLRGEPTRRLDDGTLRGSVAGQLQEVNNWLDKLNEWLLDRGAMRVIAVIGGLLLALLASAALPLKKGTLLDGGWLRARPRTIDGADPGRDFAGLLDRYDDDRYRGSFLIPAAVVRDTVDDRLARLLGEPQPLSALTAVDLLSRVEARCGLAARDALATMLLALQKLPSRAQAESEWAGRWVPKREFERLRREAIQLYAALDAGGGSP